MSVASQIKTPGQVKGPGSGAGASFSGTSGQITLGDGTAADNVPAGAFDNLSASDITTAGGALESTRAAADTALAAPQYVTLATSATLPNERVLTGTTNQITLTDNGAGGTLVLSTPQNLHTGATPTFAGESLTGPLQMTGTHSSAGNTVTNIFRGSSGEATVNSAWLNWGWNGANYHTFGTTGWQLVSGTTGAGNAIANIFRNSGGGITSNVPTGATHISTVNGARVGGFPLTPSDMPGQLAIFRRTGSNGTATAATKVAVPFNTESQDVGNNVSIASGVITFANTGVYRILFNCYLSAAAYIGISKPNSSTTYGGLDYTRPDGSGDHFGQTSVVLNIAAGDAVRCIVESNAGGNILYSNGTSVGDGDATWCTIERIQ